MDTPSIYIYKYIYIHMYTVLVHKITVPRCSIYGIFTYWSTIKVKQMKLNIPVQWILWGSFSHRIVIQRRLSSSFTQMLHVWYIYLYISLKNVAICSLVGKQSLHSAHLCLVLSLPQSRLRFQTFERSPCPFAAGGIGAASLIEGHCCFEKGRVSPHGFPLGKQPF